VSIINLIISLLSGAVGGNLAGALLKEKSLGTLGNSLAGIFGGGIGGAVLQALGLFATSGDSFDPAAVFGNIASSGAGGSLLLLIISFIKKNVLAKS
jgi:uncharacterized membrane protein YeaQ/YmgE (transglycosylase-associated protein family)